MGWFDKQNAGSLSNHLVEDLNKMKDGMSDKAGECVSSVARVIGCSVFSFIKGWKLTIVFLSVAPFIVIAFNLTIKVCTEFW